MDAQLDTQLASRVGLQLQSRSVQRRRFWYLVIVEYVAFVELSGSFLCTGCSTQEQNCVPPSGLAGPCAASCAAGRDAPAAQLPAWLLAETEMIVVIRGADKQHHRELQRCINPSFSLQCGA